MDNRKQYTSKVVDNVINFMAMAGTGIIRSKEEMDEMLNKIPEEFHPSMLAALSAAHTVRKIKTMAKLSSIFPIEEILDKAKKHKD